MPCFCGTRWSVRAVGMAPAFFREWLVLLCSVPASPTVAVGHILSNQCVCVCEWHIVYTIYICIPCYILCPPLNTSPPPFQSEFPAQDFTSNIYTPHPLLGCSHELVYTCSIACPQCLLVLLLFLFKWYIPDITDGVCFRHNSKEGGGHKCEEGSTKKPPSLLAFEVVCREGVYIIMRHYGIYIINILKVLCNGHVFTA